MYSTLPYNKTEHGGFMENWLPHRDVLDIWKIQGIINESIISKATYSYSLTIYKVEYPLESFFAVQYSLGDILKATGFSERVIIPIIPGKKPQIDFDNESMFCGEHAQVLDTEKAIVLRLRGNGFGLDMRLDKFNDPIWLGEDGRFAVRDSKVASKSLYMGTMPAMRSFGRLYLDGQDLRVQGVSSIERCWGKVPVRDARIHWEKFYLFFNNNDEISLISMPLLQKQKGLYIPDQGETVAMDSFMIEPVEYLEIDEWRFSSLWRLRLPEIKQEPLYLIPMIKSQFVLPICRPVVGIFDRLGHNFGFGHVELMPGARNELDKIGLRLYKNNYISI